MQCARVLVCVNLRTTAVIINREIIISMDTVFAIVLQLYSL